MTRRKVKMRKTIDSSWVEVLTLCRGDVCHAKRELIFCPYWRCGDEVAKYDSLLCPPVVDRHQRLGVSELFASATPPSPATDHCAVAHPASLS